MSCCHHGIHSSVLENNHLHQGESRSQARPTLTSLAAARSSSSSRSCWLVASRFCLHSLWHSSCSRIFSSAAASRSWSCRMRARSSWLRSTSRCGEGRAWSGSVIHRGARQAYQPQKDRNRTGRETWMPGLPVRQHGASHSERQLAWTALHTRHTICSPPPSLQEEIKHRKSTIQT